MPAYKQKLTGEQEYLTQEWIASKYVGYFDPCPFPRPEWNGLQVDWGQKAFVNPPFRYVRPWVEKAITESEKGCLVHMLLPVAISTAVWHDLIFPKAREIIFLKRHQPYLRIRDNKIVKIESCIVIFALPDKDRGRHDNGDDDGDDVWEERTSVKARVSNR